MLKNLRRKIAAAVRRKTRRPNTHAVPRPRFERSDPLARRGVETGSMPLNEVVFWHEEGLVELPALQVKLKQATTETDAADELWSAPLKSLFQHIIG